MGTCKSCGRNEITVSGTIGYCADCIRNGFDALWPSIKAIHDRSRRIHHLPTDPPNDPQGVNCPLCFQECRIAEGRTGYCGVRRVQNGRLIGGRPHEGNLSYYYDALPTNCVADFVCPAGTACGYPEFSVSQGPEYGYRNLAVFYHACSFNCLFCQNHQFRAHTFDRNRVSADDLAKAADERVTCICYFGGDPSPQVLHALKASSKAIEEAQGRVMRICWETNGCVQRPFLKKMAELSLKSGGCIKFDLKAWDDRIHRALCGVTNAKTLDNFRWLSGFIPQRPEPPFLVACTLLVPGYVDVQEVSAISAFLAGLDRDIPYRLLAFYPHFHLTDLPPTSRPHAERCREASVQAGLRRVSVGNLHLLGNAYS